MRVIVCGGRNFTDSQLLLRTLDGIGGITVVIEGGQRTRGRDGRIVGGADYWAMRWARLRMLECLTFEARWDDIDTQPVVLRSRDGRYYNAAAGFVRNRRMLFEGRPDKVVAFPGGKGTEDMVRQALEAGIEVIEVKAP